MHVGFLHDLANFPLYFPLGARYKGRATEEERSCQCNQVHKHRIGRNATRNPDGQVWETGGGFPAWEVIFHGRKKADAIAAADACEIHAVVTPAYLSEVIYDNGKEPGSRIRDVKGRVLCNGTFAQSY